MSDMIKRVALVIDETLGSLIDIDGGRLQGELDRRLALAAGKVIEAMREHLVQCANRDKEQGYYAAIEELEEALGEDAV